MRLDHHLITMVMGSRDGIFSNFFVLMERSGKTGGLKPIRIQPVDFDRTLRNSTILETHLWDIHLKHHPEYREALCDRYLELRSDAWSDAGLLETLDGVVSELQPDLDGLWRNDEARRSQSEEEYERIREWFPARLRQLDAWIADLQEPPSD